MSKNKKFLKIEDFQIKIIHISETLTAKNGNKYVILGVLLDHKDAEQSQLNQIAFFMKQEQPE